VPGAEAEIAAFAARREALVDWARRLREERRTAERAGALAASLQARG